jgi:translation elongation factor EF-1alpha
MLVGFLLQVFTTYFKGLHGDNMLHPSKDKNAEWYKGDTFFTILDELSI